MSNLNFKFDFEYRNLIEGKHLALAAEDQMRVFRSDGWITSAKLEELPGEVLAEAAAAKANRVQWLVRMGDAVVHLEIQELSLMFRIAAPDTASCEAALETVKHALPLDLGKDEDVPVRFWWWHGHSADEMAQRTPAPEWDTVRQNYSRPTLDSLSNLSAWECPPTSGGRLMLWHGAPGTGKTTAIRALARQWRSWAEFQFITDPEQFLSNPGYLLEVAANAPATMDPEEVVSGWRVLVLEDAGEYLSADAKKLAGQGLSRLLNLSDGVLGHATKVLILVTTNEQLQSLHPALTRPGRCAVETEFHQLDRSEIERWCGERGIVPPSTERASLAEMFAHADGRLALTPSPSFGFAAA